MTRSAAELEREVEASRGKLDRTVDALKDKMTPGQLFDEATHAMGGAGQHVLAKFVEQAKENPMPLAVMGVGLAWLMTSSNKPKPGPFPANLRAYSSDHPGGSADGLGDKAHALGDKASDLVSGARDKIAGGAASAGEAGLAAARNVGAMAGSAVDKAGEYGRRAQQTFIDVLNREPLLIGAIGVAVGAAIGAALPGTSAEDHAVGPMRDHLLEKGKEIAQEGLGQVAEVAEAAYGAVKSELQTGADDPDLAQRVEDASRAGVQAAKAELSNGSPAEG